MLKDIILKLDGIALILSITCLGYFVYSRVREFRVKTLFDKCFISILSIVFLCCGARIYYLAITELLLR